MKAYRWAVAAAVLAGAVGTGLPASGETPGAVSFTITDFRGHPALQAIVVGRVGSSSNNVFQLETDALGQAASAAVPPATYHVLIEPNRSLTDATGQYEQTLTVVSGETAHLDFQLPASDWASGRVTDRVTHKGLAGVEVVASSQCHYAGDLCDAMWGRTDADGYYTVHGLYADPSWPATYTVYLYSPDDVYSPLQKTYTFTSQAGLGHDGLDFKRLTGNPDIPSI